MNGKQNRVVRNIVALLVNQLGTWALTFVMTIVVVPYLGSERWGLLAFIQSYAAIFAVAMSLGTGTYLTWRIAREPELAGRLTFNTLILQIPLTVICIAAALAILPSLDSSSMTFKIAALSMVSTGLAALYATCVSALAGLQVMRVPAFINLIAAAVSTALLVACVMQHRGLLAFAVVTLVTQCATLFAFLIYTHRVIHFAPPLDPRLWRTIAVGGMPFFAWAIILIFYGQIDITMLKVMVGNAQVGWYAAAGRVVSIPVFLPTIVMSAVMPALSREHDPTSPRFQELASRALRLVMAGGIPAAAGTIMVSGALVYFLHFPTSFDQMAPLITILALNMPIVALDMVLGTVLIALGRQRAWTGVGVVSAIFNPLANLWAIPFTQAAFGNGAIGAAAVTLATEVVMLIGALILKPRNVFTWSDVWYIVRCLLATLVMVPALWALSAQFSIHSRPGLLVAVGYGLLVYVVAAYALHVFTNDDIKLVIVAAVAKVDLRVDVSQLSLGEIFELLGTYSATKARDVGQRVAVVSRPLTNTTSQLIARVGSVSRPIIETARYAGSRISGAPLPLFESALSHGGALSPLGVSVEIDNQDGSAYERGDGKGAVALASREEALRSAPRGTVHASDRLQPALRADHPSDGPATGDEETLKLRVKGGQQLSYWSGRNTPAVERHQRSDPGVTDRLEPGKRGPRYPKSRTKSPSGRTAGRRNT